MTVRIRDCVGCRRGVGKTGRELCARCHWKAQHAPAKQACPGCGRDKVLNPDTGQCTTCSRTCRICGHPVLFTDRDLCSGCRRRAESDANKAECPRCGKPGLLRETTGWCGPCSRPGRPPNPETACIDCGTLTRLTGAGRCHRCWNRSPHRVQVRAANLADSLEDPPAWLGEFATYLLPRHHPQRACAMLTRLGLLLVDGGLSPPQTLLEHAATGEEPLARALEDFFTGNRLALPLDWEERRAARRRQARIDAVPSPLRPAAAAFAEYLLAARDRARTAGTQARKHATLDARLTAVRDLAVFLGKNRSKTDWATVDVGDIEAFLHPRASRRAWYLAGLRQFFSFTVRTRRVLIDPTRGLTAPQPWGFKGATLTLDQQRWLFRRWSTDADVHPHEALVGLLALLHGATTTEIQHLTDDAIDSSRRSVWLGRRPQPTPLDPWTWTALQNCLAHRRTLNSANPHVLITKQTKSTRAPASDGYVKHRLDPVGIQPRILRSTRLADLVTTIDAKLVATAYGMTNDAVIAYLADHVDPTRLSNP
jgi:site-specific recombinase XerC